MTAFFTTERILNVLKACLTLTNKMFPPWSNHTRQYATRKPPEIKQMAAILIFALWEKPGESAKFGSEGRSGKDRRRSRALCISSKFPEISVRQKVENVSSARPTGKFPEKVENLKGTVEPRLTTTSLIRPPRCYDHFFCPGETSIHFLIRKPR